MSFLGEKEVILFQGDSITDCGRNYGDIKCLGKGYPFLVASFLSAYYVDSELTFINKGISGHRVKDLAARWERDCIDLKPTIVSIMIGINDTWRRYDSNDATSAEAYEKDFRDILARTKSGLGDGVKLIILEPFVLHTDDGKYAWREDLDPKIQAARKLSREFGALYIPLDGMFAASSIRKPPSFWAEDGVHPTNAGHMLIADAWVNAIK